MRALTDGLRNRLRQTQTNRQTGVLLNGQKDRERDEQGNTDTDKN